MLVISIAMKLILKSIECLKKVKSIYSEGL